MGKYYADFYDKIPLGIVNKQITGCGASSFALENDSPVVLVVPNTSMILNKVAQYPNNRRSEPIIGIYQGVDLSTLNYYLTKVKVPKIIVTYDSFPKITQFINTDFHIIIDEFQCLLDDYSYRSTAINNLIEEALHYPKLSFISATPIHKKFLPKCLVNFPYTKLTWTNTSPIVVYPTSTNKVNLAVRNIVYKYRKGLFNVKNNAGKEIKSEAAYFFVNSITLIRKIIKDSNLMPSEVRIICSNNKINKRTFKRFGIGSTEEPEKMFNFVTSTAFKGSDFYSNNGVCFVISNSLNKYSFVSIDEVYQIAGRIRNENNPFRSIIFHIFNQSPLELSDSEFNENKKFKIKGTHYWLKLLSSTDKQELPFLLRGFKDDEFFVLLNKDIACYDNLKDLHETRIYHSIVKPYQLGLSVVNTYNESENFAVKKSFIQTFDFAKSTSFTDMCKLFLEGDCSLEIIKESYPLIAEAFEKLGKRKMRALGCNKTKLRDELNNLKHEDEVYQHIKNCIKPGFYTSADAKAQLFNLYSNLEIKKLPKTSDFENALNVKLIQKLINGKRIRGYEVI